MAINFPSSPTLNQEYTAGDRTWIWNGSAWSLKTNHLIASTDRLTTARTIEIAGAVSGSTTFDGSSDVTITTTLAPSDLPFVLNKNVVSSNCNIPENYNAVSAGPVTIPPGIAVDIAPGSTWVIV